MLLLFVNGMLVKSDTSALSGMGVQESFGRRAGEGFSLSADNRNVLLGLNFPTLPPPRSGQREKRGKKKERKTKEKKQQCSDAER